MLEILTVFFSSLAIIWARKNDIQQEIADQQSRIQLADAFRHPKDKLNANLNRFHTLLLNVIGEGVHIPAFCLATSLSFSAAAFLVAIVNGSPSIESLYLPHHTRFPEYHRLLFAGVVLASAALFLIARYRSTPRGGNVNNTAPLYTMSRRLKSPIIWGHMFCALFLVAAVHFTYHNHMLSLLTLIIAGGAALTCNPTIPNSILILHARIPTSISAALGVLGFMVATLSFTSQYLPNTVWRAAVGLASTSALLAYIGTRTTTINANSEVDSFNRSAFGVVSSYAGRPSMFGGFYCTRAPGPFCLAVGLLILFCAVLKYLAADPVVVASSIIMELCIFAAGATAISGAGALAFGAMLFITLYVAFGVGDPVVIFEKWSYVLVF